MEKEQQTAAAKLIDYLRSNSAFCDSSGTVVNTIELSKTFQNHQRSISIELTRLLDAGVLLLKGHNRQKQGRPTKIVALARGCETGDDWQKTLVEKAPYRKYDYRRNHQSPIGDPRPKNKKAPRLSNMIDVMREMVALTEELKQVHQENIGHKEKLNAALEENNALKQKVGELENELALVEKTNREQQLELSAVTAQVRENLGQLQGFRVRNHQLNRQLSGFEG